MTTLIEAGTATGYAAIKGVWSGTPGELDPALNITFDCLGYDSSGVTGQGKARGYAVVAHDTTILEYDATVTAYSTITGTMVVGTAVTDTTVTAYGVPSGTLLLEATKKNWVSWSNIGSLVFTIDRMNVDRKSVV